MTVPVDQEEFAGKRRLEHGGLERDELLKLWTQLTQLFCFFCFFVFFLLIHRDICCWAVCMYCMLSVLNWLHSLWFFSGIKEADLQYIKILFIQTQYFSVSPVCPWAVVLCICTDWVIWCWNYCPLIPALSFTDNLWLLKVSLYCIKV